MGVSITGRLSRDGQKKWYTFEFGKSADQRKATGIFTYANPGSRVQKKHNSEAIALLEVKKAEIILESQSYGTSYVPSHRFKENFLDYYADFVQENKRPTNRHLEKSFEKFKLFIKKKFVSHFSITQNVCFRFRRFLMDKHTGKTPADYFSSFKRVVRSATKDGYFRTNPAEELRCKTSPCKRLREFLEPEEYIMLLETPLTNKEVRDAFIFCCYTGLRWCDVSSLCWYHINGDILFGRAIQKKTGRPVELFLHPVAQQVLTNKKKQNGSAKALGKVFHLPTANGANKALGKWVRDAGINKYITWKDARLSFSILLQDANVDTATVALLLGHSTTRHVFETYKRYRPKDQREHIMKLPIDPRGESD